MIVRRLAVALRLPHQPAGWNAGKPHGLAGQVGLIREAGIGGKSGQLSAGMGAILRQREERLETERPLQDLRRQADGGRAPAPQLALGDVERRRERRDVLMHSRP